MRGPGEGRRDSSSKSGHGRVAVIVGAGWDPEKRRERGNERWFDVRVSGERAVAPDEWPEGAGHAPLESRDDELSDHAAGAASQGFRAWWPE